MHDDRTLIEARIDRVLTERLRPAVYPSSAPVRIEVWHAPGEPVAASVGLAAEYSPCQVGDRWGPAWGTSWFRVTGTVPQAWAGSTVELLFDPGFERVMAGFQCEGLVYSGDGTPIKGLNPRNSWVRVGNPASGGEDVTFYIEAAANPVIHDERHIFLPTHLGELSTAGPELLYRLTRVELAVFDEQVWQLVADLEVLTQLMHELSTDSPRRWEILRTCGRALDVLDLDDISGTTKATRAVLAEALAAPAHASAHRLSAVGHAHIDSAWLWPLRETVRKVARTTANVTALMDDHPEFVFAMSQAQQLAWLRDHHPALFARVKEKVAAGQFVPVGGMWVESDTNMPGGEAMARQFVHGKRFFATEFGIETDEVWLPDSFGYSASLPQLVALSASTWFLTQKISWNQTNKFPHHTFFWEGIDGTRVFTHFPPVDTYNSELSGTELAHASANYQEKGRGQRSLVPFGWGDGGGGPTREMLARAARLTDLEGSPRVEIEPPVEFFRKAHEDYPDAPVWVGELYLEFHRGTYTSQARTKQGNRRSEHLLREAELWSATAFVRRGHPYPYEQLDRLWKAVLLNQFHDILPGSSIAWVHREAERTYAAVAGELTTIIDEAQRALAGIGDRPITFNAAPHARDGVAAGGAEVVTPAGDAVAVNAVDGGFELDNGLLRVTVDRRGLVGSILDLSAGREVVAPGAHANLLQLHPDLPNKWDAWDVDEFYRNTGTDLVEVDEITRVDGGVRIVRSFSRSRVTQLLTLHPGAQRLDIETEVDWQEKEKFLKLAFPLDVQADRSASETQFGHVYRATHANTSWDAAKFEICAHRWVHLAEPGYGVALANDSSYGHDVTRSAKEGGGIATTIRASLLRAPRFPDPETDQGVHRLRHALVVGAELADAVREGYFLNLPARVVEGAGPVEPLLTVDDPAVCVESVKLADDGSGDVVARLYQATGARSTTTITTYFGPDHAWTTDLLERRWPRTEEHRLSEGALTLRLRPFEIVTLRFASP
ncbi:alpha-mannosidase [Pseudonocardia spinosispora]|uniref:alpha-mannosidase n=1 Tax=Pseudonocardia spinosispora TaxID=103441 RepID=UPI0004042282|nr:glycoside hydrolase family 38 C-terminal domain-containing protein [Pseudonocardia spinosispora]